MEAIQVFKVEFDKMENRLPNARIETLLGTFSVKGVLSAHGNAGKFISNLDPEKSYLGWDGKVYPQIYIKTIKIS